MFEFLFKYSRVTFNNGEIVSASVLPTGVMIVAICCLAVLLGWTLFKQRRSLPPVGLLLIGATQLLMVVVVATMVWNPVLQIDFTRPGENRVVLLLDTSESMRYGGDELSRVEQALEELDDTFLNEISEIAELDMATFDGELRSIESLETLPAPGQTTNIAAALTNTLNSARQSPLSAVVIVTDGSDNSGNANAEWLSSLRQFDTPIHTVGVGRETVAEDTELTDVSIEQIITPNSKAYAQLTITSGSTQEAEIKLYSGSNILASKPISLRQGVSNHTLEFDSGEEGVIDLEFVLVGQSGEVNQTNNTQNRILQVQDTPRRVLYFEGEPRWEYKFIQRALAEEPSLLVSTLLRTSPNKFYRQGIAEPDELEEGFPLDRETLFKYDALILGSIEAALLSPEQLLHIKEFVSERGGSLLMLGGLRGLNSGGWGVTPVGDVLPVTLADPETETFVRQQTSALLTDAGAHSPILQLSEDAEENNQIWASLPRIADFQEVGSPKPGATSLLEVVSTTGAAPLLATQRYGRGSATVLATGGTWNWQMKMPSADLTHETFWTRLVQSMVLTSPQRLSLTTDQAQYRDTQEVEINAELRDELFRPIINADVTALAVNQREEAIEVLLRPVEGEPGKYQGNLLAEDAGDWRVDLTAREGETVLGEGSRYFSRSVGESEHFSVAQNRTLLEQIADETGGEYRTLNELSTLGDSLRFSDSGIQERQLLPLWNMPLFFLALLALKCLEWGVRLLWRRL